MRNDADAKLSGGPFVELLLAQSEALVVAAGGLAKIKVPLDDAICQVLDMLQETPDGAISGGDLATRLDPQRLLLMAAGVSKISGRSIDSLMEEVFQAHPKVPRKFSQTTRYEVHTLDGFERAIAHGEKSNNALLIPEFVIEDVARGSAFYAVEWNGYQEGTISLRLGGEAKISRIEVERVMGIDNADASSDLIELAQLLAGSWATSGQLDCWVTYASRCATWKRLASESSWWCSQ